MPAKVGAVFVAALATLSMLGAGPATSPAGAAAGRTFLIDTDSVTAFDLITADNKCLDSELTCSLRAAIQQANATSSDIPVFIGVADSVDRTLSLSTAQARSITAGKYSPLDLIPYYTITRPMVIDLAGLLHIKSTDDIQAEPTTAFLVDAPNVELRNFADVYSSNTSIVLTENADGTIITGARATNPPNNFPNHFIRIEPGADNITIQSSTMGRFNGVKEATSGMVHIRTDVSEEPVSNIKILGVDFTNTPSTSKPVCTTTSATGCAQGAVAIYGRGPLNGLRIEECTFTGFPDGIDALDLDDAGNSADWDIARNVFTEIASGPDNYDAPIQLPVGRSLSGMNFIRKNTFQNRKELQQAHAIRWWGPGTPSGNLASNLYILENYFDGYQSQTILLNHAGTTTVHKNTFGLNSASASPTELEETWGESLGYDMPLLFTNYNEETNRRILTWFPTEAAVQRCELAITVDRHTEIPEGYNSPTEPVTLDFYYTAGSAAEEYLGSVGDLTEPTTVRFPDLPQQAGFIRIQTQGSSPNGQPESSQYSRTVEYEGPSGCWTPRVDLTVRAWTGLDDPTADYDEILEGDGVEVPSNLTMAPGTPVWFTYTVDNPTGTTLTNVVVRDSLPEPVCTIEEIPPLSEAGCVRYTTVDVPPDD